MNTRGAAVVAGWAAFNGVLTIILVGFYGGYPFEWALYTGSVTLVGLVALAVLFTRPEGRNYPHPAGGEIAALIALGAILIALALIYGWWLIMFAAMPLAAAVLRLMSRAGNG